MKVTAISKDGKFLKIGEGLPDSVWHSYEEAITDVVKTIVKGDEVETKYDVVADGKRVLTYIKKIASAPVPPTGGADTTTTPYKKPWVEYGTKSPEVQDSIRKQAVGHMTSRTLISLQGHVTPENVIELIDKLYTKYLDITKA